MYRSYKYQDIRPKFGECWRISTFKNILKFSYANGNGAFLPKALFYFIHVIYKDVCNCYSLISFRRKPRNKLAVSNFRSFLEQTPVGQSANINTWRHIILFCAAGEGRVSVGGVCFVLCKTHRSSSFMTSEAFFAVASLSWIYVDDTWS